MRKIKEVIVVEGRYDINKLRQLVSCAVIETSGFGIFSDAEKLKLLRRLADRRGLIIMTDSDGAGFLIRNYLKGALPGENVKHAYIPDIPGREKRKRSGGGLLGVEGMPPEVILASLEKAGATFLDEDGDTPEKTPGGITKNDLYFAAISGRPGSADRRRELLKKLDLPQKLSTNAMLQVLNALFTREEFLNFL
jgi:ribonuclease M5